MAACCYTPERESRCWFLTVSSYSCDMNFSTTKDSKRPKLDVRQLGLSIATDDPKQPKPSEANVVTAAYLARVRPGFLWFPPKNKSSYETLAVLGCYSKLSQKIPHSDQVWAVMTSLLPFSSLN